MISENQNIIIVYIMKKMHHSLATAFLRTGKKIKIGTCVASHTTSVR